jgi:UV DNA damage endonuclease
MIKRMGFACKFVVPSKKGFSPVPELNGRATTVAWLNRQTRSDAEQRLWDIMEHNIAAARALVVTVGSLVPELRMVRLGSDILPVYTEPSWRYFWQQSYVRAYCERSFAELGRVAQAMDVRLSFHPGQFCVLASDRSDVVDRSIEEFEYHADMARWMNFGKRFQDFKINVHISGRAGPAGIQAVIPRLSQEARNCITIENDEISWGVDHSLELANHCALVLDIHHHYIKTGEYIEANDDRIKKFIDSWRGVRPVIHYSVSREDCLVDHAQDQRPDLQMLLEQGHKKAHLRAHSDFCWNDAVNDWALTHWEWADILVEAKAKNLASFALHKHATQQVF